MSRQKSGTKSGWKRRDRKYREEVAAQAKANRQRRASYLAAAATNTVNERALAIEAAGAMVEWPPEADEDAA